MPATVLEIRRYPVKSMAGEALDRVDVDARGLVGDRAYAVVDADGRFAAGKDSRRFRRRDEVFRYGAVTASDGTVRVARDDAQGSDQWAAGDTALDDELSGRFGDPVRVLLENGTSHFDARSVSVVGTATLEWCARELGVDADRRRLRTNLIVETAEPFEEEGWVGHEVAIGGVLLAVVERVERCRTIDLAQDGVATTTPWLKALGGARELCVAVYADVVAPGSLAVGDTVAVR
ncbi:MAG TPA: MOSC N-terminal beta barrel domain-containing protein [Nocardioides sp.]|nr:MOSC N-terminal beta barrel domain-containing protein [Nocardioides sp.]